MNVVDLNRSIDFYREVLGFTRCYPRDEQLAAVSAPGNDQAQVIVLRAFGSGSSRRSWPHRSASLHIGRRVSRSTRSGSLVIWILGDSSSAGVITASGLLWWAATRTGWP